jgi:RHS repeat-associated protein
VESLSTVVDNETLWALSDAQGTVRDVLDSSGTQRKHSSYDAFGKVQGEQWYDAAGDLIGGATPWTDPEAVDQVFYFTGRLLDRATGLQNNLNRWYDPKIGRWLSEDPISFAAGDANLYRYVGNSPTNLTDPSGQIPPLILLGIGVGAWFGFGSSPNIANAPGPGDPVHPDPGPGGCEPQNGLIGAGIGAAVGGGATWGFGGWGTGGGPDVGSGGGIIEEFDLPGNPTLDPDDVKYWWPQDLCPHRPAPLPGQEFYPPVYPN